MTQCLQQQATGRKLHMTCVDIQRKPSIDLAKSKERQRLLTRIRAQEFHAILLSPPCSTFSRAPWATFKGPRPVRSAARPRGLDKLTAAERDRCILGNIFADFTWEVVELAIEVNVSFLLLEQPEDLGMLAKGPYKGQRPASMWQWPAMDRVAKLPQVTTLALHHKVVLVLTIPSRRACCYWGHVICQTSAMWALLFTTTTGATWDRYRAYTTSLR